MSEYYSAREAHALMGKRFRSTRGYVDVPVGTIGTVVGVYCASGKDYGVDIEWYGLTVGLSGRPLQDGFSRTDIEMGLEAIA